jgi:hypothetical protein
MLLLPYRQHSVPLSTYLRGHEAMAAHPDANWNDRLTLEYRYQGEGEFQGLKCHVVWMVSCSKKSGNPLTRTELWLAEDRNYIPVRRFTYTYWCSEEIPAGEGAVEAWKEVEPGVWFPLEAEVTVYNKKAIQRERKQELRWRERYTTEMVSLDPKYDVSFFREVEFPTGTAVYEVEDDTIVRSYRVGAPGAPGGPDSSGAPTHWWILWINLAALAALTALVLVIRRRSRGEAGPALRS